LAEDHAALRAASKPGTGLCTIVNIEGSFSRRLGAQLAVGADGEVTGSLADGCLERELAAEIARGGPPRIIRYGKGSPKIDFRLPCGGGLDILIEPAPDHDLCAAIASQLDRREEAALPLGEDSPLAQRRYIPALRLILFGEGPELAAMANLAVHTGMQVESHAREGGALALGQQPDHISADPHAAVVLLFHDHEWEAAILDWALRSPAFFIGAQGGAPARAERDARLAAMGYAPRQIARIASPIGTVGHSREPAALALSVLAGIAGEYELCHPHHAPGAR